MLTIETARVDLAAGQRDAEADLAPGTYVRMTVRDTGEGMDRETQCHLYEPFFTTKQRGKGTGLGLSSVYGSVQQFQGRIFLASEVGKGTTFSLYFPRCESPEPSGDAAPEAPREIRGTETILLVEDEVPLRRMLREALGNAGYRIWEAGNGAQALEIFDADPARIDLVLTDIVMPVMNGLKLAEELRNRRPNLKVMFMSGHAEEMITGQNNGLELPADFLTKPFLPDELVSKVREVLDRSAKDATPRRRAT